MAKSPAVAEKLDRRPVAESDGAFLLKVYASTREEEMAMVDWSDKQKEMFLQSQLAAQRVDYDARFPDSVQEILLFDGNPVGQIWTWRSDEEIRLLDIALLPEYRRLGIGTILLTELQEEAARAARPMRHCVYKTNTPAMAFYRRLGFTRVEDMGMYILMEWNQQASAT